MKWYFSWWTRWSPMKKSFTSTCRRTKKGYVLLESKSMLMAPSRSRKDHCQHHQMKMTTKSIKRKKNAKSLNPFWKGQKRLGLTICFLPSLEMVRMRDSLCRARYTTCRKTFNLRINQSARLHQLQVWWQLQTHRSINQHHRLTMITISIEAVEGWPRWAMRVAS